MQLRYISIPALIAAAAGDPWAVNHSLQVGRPAQIAGLAEAFRAAGRCTAEADSAFEQARSRFDAAWNHQDGDHPINDSAEVQRVIKALGAQSLQLPKIGVDLENIAAALAEAQKAAAGQIAALEGQLRQLDDLIGQAVEMEKDPQLTADDRAALDAFIRTCETDAIRDVQAVLAQLQSTRNGYSATLQSARATLRADGYDPKPLEPVDAQPTPEQIEIPPPSTKPEDAKRWWDSLSQDERDQLLAQHPPELGNLNGIDTVFRDKVNQASRNTTMSPSTR
jgi:hypothetical protein